MGLRRRLAGLFALVVIVGIIAGLPVVLLALGANPLDASIPAWGEITEALTSPDDGTILLTLVKVVAWVAWAFMTLSILLEVASRVRGIRAPRLPGLRMPQKAARGLVSTAMMLFVAVPLGAGAANAADIATAPAPAIAAPVAVAPASVGDTPATDVEVDRDKHTVPTVDTVTHTVEQGQTLWSIAQDRLGDGHRYTEIVDLNRDVLGGTAGFIKAGWRLQIPAPPATQAPEVVDEAEAAAQEEITVQSGDTLWDLAEDHMGDGHRYPEIVEASEGITQPDGARLTDPDLIHPGWTLHVPVGQTEAAEQVPAEDQTKPDPAPETEPVEDAAPAQDEDRPVEDAQPSDLAPINTTEEAPVADTAQDDTAADTAAAIATDDGDSWRTSTIYGVGAVLAAGVLALLAARRHTQQRVRKPGQRLPIPSAGAGRVEQDLRAVADPLSVETVDATLRALAAHCTSTGAALPEVRAARLTATQFDLYLAQPAELPTPWSGTADDTVWTLKVEDATGDAPDDVPAPYPALVTIGHDDEEGHVLLNLEHLGTLGVRADDEEATREVLAALTLELATSSWADDLQVTIVGAYPELEDSLRTGRIRYLPAAGRLLDDLEQRATADRLALAENEATSLEHARAAGLTPDAWAPEIVLIAGQITDHQRTRLAKLVDELPRVALAAVTTGDHPVGQWSLNLAGDGAATLDPIGLELRAQRIPVEQYRALLEVAVLTDVDELTGDQVTEPTLDDVEQVTPVDEPATDVDESTAPVHDATSDVDETDEDLEAFAGIDDPASLPVHLTLGKHPEDDALSAEGREEPQEAAVAVQEHEIAPEAPEVQDEPLEPQEAAQTTPEAQDALVNVQETTEPQEASVGAGEDEAVDGQVSALPLPPPKILVLGPVDLVNATGPVESTKRARLLEYAAYLALNPSASHTEIDDAIWPDRKTDDNLNTRNTATSKLRRWVGASPEGEDYLPRHQSGRGYGFLPAVTTDVDDWRTLVGDDPLDAPTEQLEQALDLVRGRPFHVTKRRRRYAWAEQLESQLIAEIVDAAYELGRRRLMEGRWRSAEQAVVIGLAIEPAQEMLWRLRILAAHEARNPDAEAEAIERLLAITDELECDLEPETETLLAALKQPRTHVDQLIANI